MNHADFLPLVKSGHIKAVRHPSLPITLYNYTPKTQYERAWCDATLSARGIMFDDSGAIVARPFRKFFNDTEVEDAPWHLTHEVTAKMDGSLLIVAEIYGETVCATRGSFTSPQSQRGAEILAAKYPGFRPLAGLTYCFEVIYPENRIVVDYGDTEDVVLLAVFDTDSGAELPREVPGLTVVETLSWSASDGELRAFIKDHEEGYVVRFQDGTRIKVKGQRYCELHRIITGCSSRTIWEYLSSGRQIEELLEHTPDEFNAFVRGEESRMTGEYQYMAAQVARVVGDLRGLPDRKSQALALAHEPSWLKAAAFLGLDGKDYAPHLWKAIYPPHIQPFMDRVAS